MTTTSGAEALARIKPVLATEDAYVLLRPDLYARWEELNDELAAATEKDRRGQRLASAASRSTKAIAQEILDLEDEIKSYELKVTFVAMQAAEWTVLCEQHPPRKKDQLDMMAGYDRDAVIEVAVRRCMVDPVFDDCTDRECDHEDCGTWQQFVRFLNPSDWAELCDTAKRVNGSVKPPKSGLAASVLGRRVAGSKSPESGAPTPAPSTGRRRAKSTSTTTPKAT